MPRFLLAVVAVVAAHGCSCGPPAGAQRLAGAAVEVAAGAAIARCSAALDAASGLAEPSARLGKVAQGCAGLVVQPDCRLAWGATPGDVSSVAAGCARAYCPKWTAKPPSACAFDWASSKPGELNLEWRELFGEILRYDWGFDGVDAMRAALSTPARTLAQGLSSGRDGMTPLVALVKATDFTVRVVTGDEEVSVELRDAHLSPLGKWTFPDRCSPPMDLEALESAALGSLAPQWRPWASWTLVTNRATKFCAVKAVMGALRDEGLLAVDFTLDPPLDPRTPARPPAQRP